MENDPLAPLRSLTGGLREALIGEQGCLKCHNFRGVGARAHHALALDGKPYGAFGLPLEDYPSDVLRRFLFEQDAVAEELRGQAAPGGEDRRRAAPRPGEPREEREEREGVDQARITFLSHAAMTGFVQVET